MQGQKCKYFNNKKAFIIKNKKHFSSVLNNEVNKNNFFGS